MSLVGRPFHASRRRALLLGACGLLGLWPLACCARPRRPAQQGLTRGNHEFAIRHGGRRRTYLLHVPPGASSAALPVVLAFRGGDGTGPQARLIRAADVGRFVSRFRRPL